MSSGRIQLAAVAATGALVLAVAGCGGSSSTGSSTSSGKTQAAGGSATSQTSAASAKKYTIGFATISPSDPFWGATAQGAKSEAAKLSDAKVVIQATPGASVSNFSAPLVAVVQNLIAQGVSAIVVPGVPQVVSELQHAVAAKIPIVFYGDGIPGSKLPKTSVAAANLQAGQLAGSYIKTQLHGQGTIALVGYARGQYAILDQRFDGVLGALKGSGVKLAGYVTNQCDTPSAVAAVQNLLTRVPKLSAIFGECAQATLGAIQAIKQAGDTGKIVVAGIDAKQPELKAILAGSEGATVNQCPQSQGAIAVKAADDVLNGKSVPTAMSSPNHLITKANAAQALTTPC